jgi:K+/H+ antiporter YhaU regulatory subunit KhtT
MSQKLTPEELEDFQAFRQEANRLASVLGELHYQKTLIDLELEGVKEGIKANTLAQQAQLKEFGTKYGDGSINVSTGEITVIPAN